MKANPDGEDLLMTEEEENDFEYNKNEKSPVEEIDNHTLYSQYHEGSKKSEYKKEDSLKLSNNSSHSLFSQKSQKSYLTQKSKKSKYGSQKDIQNESVKALT